MIRIAVCDDDEIFICKIMKPLLSRALKNAGIYAEPDFFTDGNLLLTEFREHRNYSIVLLDIDMPSINGKELAKKLRELDKDFWLAFISSYKDEVYNVFDLNIVDFIPKDYNKNKCLEELTKLLKRYVSEKPKQKLFNILDNGKHAFIKISLDSILYIKMDKGKVVLHTFDEEFILEERALKSLENELGSFGFFKICSNTLVNVGKIYEVLDNKVVLNNKINLPVSRRRRKELLTRLSMAISAKVVT